jgi:hypothetical protein
LTYFNLLKLLVKDVPWDKALYLDTALYLDRRGQLYQTTSKEVKYGEGEDHPEDEFVEPKFELIPGTLEHITELMVEKVEHHPYELIINYIVLTGAEGSFAFA